MWFVAILISWVIVIALWEIKRGLDTAAKLPNNMNAASMMTGVPTTPITSVNSFRMLAVRFTLSTTFTITGS